MHIQSSTIQAVLQCEKNLVEDALVAKTLQIVSRYAYAKVNVYLHRIDKERNHPDIGDYDVIGFYPEKNVVLNIECKDILCPYCLKDSRRLARKDLWQTW